MPASSGGAGAVAGLAPLLTAQQAGQILSVPASWVLAEARADRIPHVRLGRYVRFDAGELAAWWQERARGPRPHGPRAQPPSRATTPRSNLVPVRDTEAA